MPTLTLNHLVQAASALHGAGQHACAVEYWNAALEVSPDDPAILTGSAVTHRALKQSDRALELIRRAVAIEPTARRQTILACAIHDQLGFEEAEQAIREALLIDRLSVDAAWLYGIWLLERWQFRATTDDSLGEAIKWLDWAAELAPLNLECQISRIAAYTAADRLLDVVRDATALLSRHPQIPEFHVHRSAARMKLGQLVQGYQEFGDWAYKLPGLAAHPFHAFPNWKGSGQWNTDSGAGVLQLGTDNSETDNVVYVWNAEGAGDYFQFIRFARAMAADGWRVRAICNDTMDRLISRVPGVESVISEDDDIPPETMLAPLPTLPAEYLGVAPLWEGPYLSADARTAGLWGKRIQHCLSRNEDEDFRGVKAGNLKIGLAWRGNPSQINDDRRSFPFERFTPLFDLPGIQLISLQHGPGVDHSPLTTHHSPVVALGDDYQRGDWLDTAGVIANLDLVIAPCTGVAHLAGAMGKPVWLALSEPCCWRWMRPDVPTSSLIPHPSALHSPWYPSMRIFRQRARGSWDGVFEAMASDLNRLARSAA
jgi:tetratricopeptide (TPR) repeat protein